MALLAVKINPSVTGSNSNNQFRRSPLFQKNKKGESEKMRMTGLLPRPQLSCRTDENLLLRRENLMFC